MHATPQQKNQEHQTQTQAPIQRKTAEALNQPWQPLSPNLSFDLPESASENSGAPIQRMEGASPQPAPAAPNRTGLPDTMKMNMESMSGSDMSSVRVIRNSTEPQRLGAYSFARYPEIHLGPGREQDLGHEAGHIVQQALGQVKANTQFMGMAGNDDARLEREATRRGNHIGNRTIPTFEGWKVNRNHQVDQVIQKAGPTPPPKSKDELKKEAYQKLENEMLEYRKERIRCIYMGVIAKRITLLTRINYFLVEKNQFSWNYDAISCKFTGNFIYRKERVIIHPPLSAPKFLMPR